jgi:1,4-dihydroxy-6-naphthoate synthase
MANEETIRLGISTCPNDTFAFHAILTGKVTIPGVLLDIQLLDVQELNEGLFHGAFDVAKASFHAALLLSDRYGVLRSGSALGFGVGPLLLASTPSSVPNATNAKSVTLCPGEHTTASLLYRLFYPNCGIVTQTIFSNIMPTLEQGAADFGVCIHEGRFTFEQHGLSCVEDLGTRWEKETSQPLPLGGILCRLDLARHKIELVQRAIYNSIQYAKAHRDEALATMRKYAQEFSDEVLFSHVDLYVNSWTEELGETGQRALEELHRRATLAGVIGNHQAALQLLPAE